MNYKEYKGNIFKEDTLLSNEYIIDKLYELDYCNEEIERLNKEIESWIKLIDYKGIEDIPQYVSDLKVDNKQLKEENQLLNKNYNIINELENWLKEEYEGTIFDYHNAIEDVLNKLQELKGSDKE